MDTKHLGCTTGLSPTKETRYCPRCLGPMPGKDGAHGTALSRTDNETYVCDPCGGDEASEYGRAIFNGATHEESVAAIIPLFDREWVAGPYAEASAELAQLAVADRPARFFAIMTALAEAATPSDRVRFVSMLEAILANQGVTSLEVN